MNDPKRAEDPRYTVRLIGKVVRVSLETVRIVEGLPGLGRMNLLPLGSACQILRQIRDADV